MPFGRVGSNLLMDYVYQSLKGRSICGNQILTGAKSLASQIKILGEFYDQEPTGHHKITKESLGAMPDPIGLSNFLAEKGVAVIRMFRRSVLKTAVSQIRAEEYAEISRAKTGTAMWGVDKNAEPLGPIEINPERLQELCMFIEHQNQLLGQMGEANNTLDIYYEDLSQDMAKELYRVATFMAFESSTYTPRFRKATNDDLSRSIVNYEEILASLPKRFTDLG